MCEGQEWRDYNLAKDQYNQRAMTISPVLMVDGKEENLQKAQQSARSNFEEWKQNIEQKYKNSDEDKDDKKTLYANAFKKLFEERRKNK
jgi:hypothetical protein